MSAAPSAPEPGPVDDVAAVILVRKGSQLPQVVQALRPLGLQHVDPSRVAKALQASPAAPATPDVFLLQADDGPRTEHPEGDALTGRERQMLHLIARGLTNQEIAASLYLSGNSVKSYVRNAYRKIGVSTRSRAVIWWYENQQLPAGPAAPYAGATAAHRTPPTTGSTP